MHQRYRSSRLFSADEPYSSLLYLRHLCHGDFGRLENSATLAGAQASSTQAMKARYVAPENNGLER
jgi:hypothetical protein